jgi:thymidylate synthase ThyX
MEVRLINTPIQYCGTWLATDFIFEIVASTKVLLEMTRHREASYACKSSRYTLNKGEVVFEKTGDAEVDTKLEDWRLIIVEAINNKKSNDIVSLMLPQAYQYKWVVRFPYTSLQNFLNLRIAKSAHYHIKEVASCMLNTLPTNLKELIQKPND